MTGGGFIPSAHVDDYELDELGQLSTESQHAVQWIGSPSVRGPRWARMPLLTVGMLGIQCVWSIEMGYASPYLLELGLSKSWMSLVFMAGPLSGLIVQPLIGVWADRSKSRLGRRRPFMIAGVAICAFGIMLLGWAREISHGLGGGTGFAIAIAVWAIYLIDFSINAAMSADRALVVDTLPPAAQEEGSAWAGRMFGFGSVAGFFVGNLDLPPVLPFLGKTQLQILSFVTSFILLICHACTSWAVTERVLLRDDRPQSKSGLFAGLKAIWDNIFSLPPGIRSVCIIQFFSFLGWFPILFFTTVWVSEIYKTSQPNLDLSDPGVDDDAVRAGARSLFFQALVNIVCSIGLPFLVAESGVQAHTSGYESLNGNGAYEEPPRSALWKRAQEEIASGGAVSKSVSWIKEKIAEVKRGEKILPLKGLTLIKLWWISQFVFFGAMVATWFVSTVGGAYCIIAVLGFPWALAQWAPYALLGELILIEGQDNHARGVPLVKRTRPSVEDTSAPQDHLPSLSNSRHASSTHSRHSSRSSMQHKDESTASSSRIPPHIDTRFDQPQPSPLVPASSRYSNDENEVSLVLHHHPEDEDDESVDSPYRPSTPIALAGGGATDTADKAGVILGIHNVFVVMPQFVVTIMSSIIFYIMEPSPTLAEQGGLENREGAISGGSSDSIGLIFRIGGLSALVGAIITLRLARAWRRGEGL